MRRSGALVTVLILSTVATLTVARSAGAREDRGTGEPPPTTAVLHGAEPWFRVDIVIRRSSCNTNYGLIGTQECNGFNETFAYDRECVGIYPWCAESSDATVRSSRASHRGAMNVVFFASARSASRYRSSRIEGTVPSDTSNRFTVTSGIAEELQFVSGNDPNIPAGQRGGPLDLDVEGGCNLLELCFYNFDVHGYVRQTNSRGSSPGAVQDGGEVPEEPTVSPSSPSSVGVVPAPSTAARPTVAAPRFTG